jgi:hypothetical protein
MLVAIGERILLTFWIGAMWSVGYVVVPILFGYLDDRQLAGMLAGQMFTAVHVTGVICGILLFVAASARGSAGRGALKTPEVWIIGAMLLVILVQFVVEPMMGHLKAQGLVQGTPQAVQFAKLHGFAEIVYLINSLLGLALVVLSGRRDRLKAA